MNRRVPVVFQTNRVECGVACLAMVLNHYGHEISLREVRDRCSMGGGGASAGGLARAARALGMRAVGHRATPELFETLPLPAIAHWAGDHFVVVERVEARHVHLVDPQLGRRRLTHTEFRAGLGAVAIGLTPGPGFERRRADIEPFWRTYARSLLALPGTRSLLAQVLLATLVLQLVGLAMPLLVRTVVDDLDVLRGSSQLALLGAGIAIIAVGQLAAGYLRSGLVLYLQGRLDTQAMLGFCAHLLRLPLRYFQQRSTGDIATRIGSIVSLREQLTGQTLTSVLDATTVLVYLAVLFSIDVATALGVAVVIGIELALLTRTTRHVRERMAADISAHAEEQGNLVEMLEGIATLKSAAAEGRAFDRWAQLYVAWMRATLRRGHATAVVESLAGTLRVVTPLIVLWLGTARVLAGGMSTGTMLAITWMAASVVAPLSALVTNGQRLQLAGAYLQRLADVMESQPEFPEAPPGPARRLRGALEVDDMTFRYDREGTPALQGVSLRVEPGQRVAVVGATGAGKTTLGLLLLGLHEPSEGVIRLDGVPLGSLDPRVVRRTIGVVLQEPFVFTGSVHENIAFHDPSISREDVVAAARVAALDEEIAALPRGYDTRLSERGTGLSGGQRQRLALARAVLGNPAVLLLDEATSHLDTVTEARVHRNLGALGCSQIIIAHRLSTVRDADLIVMLDRGRVIERGTHRDLLARGGKYATLIGDQMRGGDWNEGVRNGSEGDRHGSARGAR